MNRLFVFLTAFLLSASSLEAQGQSQQDTSGQATPPTVRSTAQEVVLDMVFRDKKGRTIRDIRPEEIHVSEDGVEQKLGHCHWILCGRSAWSHSSSRDWTKRKNGSSARH